MDAIGEPLLERLQRNPRHDPGNDRLEVIPQPGLDQENDREQNPDRLEKSAQHECYPGPTRAGRRSHMDRALAYFKGRFLDAFRSGWMGIADSRPVPP